MLEFFPFLAYLYSMIIYLTLSHSLLVILLTFLRLLTFNIISTMLLHLHHKIPLASKLFCQNCLHVSIGPLCQHFQFPKGAASITLKAPSTLMDTLLRIFTNWLKWMGLACDLSWHGSYSTSWFQSSEDRLGLERLSAFQEIDTNHSHGW